MSYKCFEDRLLSCEDDEFVLKVDVDIREYLNSFPKNRWVNVFMYWRSASAIKKKERKKDSQRKVLTRAEKVVSCIKLVAPNEIEKILLKTREIWNNCTKYTTQRKLKMMKRIETGSDIKRTTKSNQRPTFVPFIHSVLLFPPVNNYRRFLIHKVCESITASQSQALSTFSIGTGDQRRTVVCHRFQLLVDLKSVTLKRFVITSTFHRILTANYHIFIVRLSFVMHRGL